MSVSSNQIAYSSSSIAPEAKSLLTLFQSGINVANCAFALFKAHQYLYGVIIERMQEEMDWQDMKKVDVWNNLPRKSKHREYDTVIEYTMKNPAVLQEYRDRIPRYYQRAHGGMSDEDLDEAIYGKLAESA